MNSIWQILLLKNAGTRALHKMNLRNISAFQKRRFQNGKQGKATTDITFLPQLATYFNITIDELMGYSPQMAKQNIRKLYHRLAEDFATKPFDSVAAECDVIIKKYYS